MITAAGKGIRTLLEQLDVVLVVGLWVFPDVFTCSQKQKQILEKKRLVCFAARPAQPGSLLRVQP